MNVAFDTHSDLKIIAIGRSGGTPPLSPICHTDLYLGAYINKVANTAPPLPGFMNSILRTCTRPRRSSTEVSLFLLPTRPRLDPGLMNIWPVGARRLEGCVVAWTGRRQERGLLNQPVIQRPSINPPNGLGCGT